MYIVLLIIIVNSYCKGFLLFILILYLYTFDIYFVRNTSASAGVKKNTFPLHDIV